jgi:hypothetical protein
MDENQKAESAPKQEQEQNIIDTLIEKGLKFNIGKREYVVKELHLGAMDMMADMFIKMEIDEDAIKENTLSAPKYEVKKSAKAFARVIAIAILDGKNYSKWRIKLFAGMLAKKIVWRVKPSVMFEISKVILQLNNYADFLNSIRLTAGARTTKPNPIEQNS